MQLTSRLEQLFKWIFLISLTITIFSGFFKDALPDPDYYATTDLDDPLQIPV